MTTRDQYNRTTPPAVLTEPVTLILDDLALEYQQ
ncbi:hypothetical protein ALP79_200296 [Pseudomonas savastanoi pv. fraxini]|nr:hypothetical protein ALP79_200296 [Pseudomonas savastanoi pv. fraxini]